MNFLSKIKSSVDTLLVIAIIICINVAAQYIFKRFDFTEEKRYSLSNTTKKGLKELQDLMYVKVYLDGALPTEFEKLKIETKELLDEMAIYSKGNLVYEFIDLSSITNEQKQKEVYDQLLEKGLEYTDLNTNKVGEQSNKIIWTGAIVTFKEKEIAVNILKNQVAESSENIINNSIQQLEYSFASAFHTLQYAKKEYVGILDGHGEAKDMELADIVTSLSAQYHVKRVHINGDTKALNLYNTIIIPSPDSTFNNSDKFIIDQFIMRGGRVLWLLDMVYVNKDTLKATSNTMGVARSLNLEDQLFTYGVRINGNLVLDMQSLPIPIITGQIAGKPKQEFLPWYYSPLLMSDNSSHYLVKNIEAIKTDFISNIDTVGVSNVKKSILLTTSKYSKIQTTPARISFNILRVTASPDQFNSSKIPVAVLLEGSFKSIFKNRVVPINAYGKQYKIRDTSIFTKQIVVADGDIIKNEVSPDGTKYAKLGYDKYTNRVYGNKDFILNCINYLCGDDGLIAARAKNFKIRLLNPSIIEKYKIAIQTIALVLPCVLILFLGLISLMIRRQKYSS